MINFDDSIIFLDYEALSFESEQVDHEHTLFQALVNEGKHIRVRMTAKPLQYDANS